LLEVEATPLVEGHKFLFFAILLGVAAFELIDTLFGASVQPNSGSSGEATTNLRV
jgi:hypothetical protein